MTRCGVAANSEAWIGRDSGSFRIASSDCGSTGVARLNDNTDNSRWETADAGMVVSSKRQTVLEGRAGWHGYVTI